jgi:hypothetical protein
VNTPVVVFFGVSCVVCWIVAYFAIIYRGFRDRTFGMPMAALAANLSWEAIYSFFLNPFGDYIHVLSIPCFAIDLVIAGQCLVYGSSNVSLPLLRKHFRKIFAAAVVIAFPIVYLSFYEFHDPLGEYTGFGLNFMMSFLFVAMLLSRGNPSGQSMYIAIFKWLGTFFSYVATAFQATTTLADPWPESLLSLVQKTVTHTTYPLTPLISVVYLVTFLVDILYIILLYGRIRECHLSPWRRV